MNCLEIPVFADGETHLLDLSCGKGAVSVRTAARFGYRKTGIDVMAAFLEDALKNPGNTVFLIFVHS